MTARSALISGASIAGPVLAFWLSDAGWDVTVVERAERLRTSGYPVDIRGTAIDVVHRMGLHDQIVAAHYRHVPVAVLSPEGLSDREACDRLAFDLRWTAAAWLMVGAGAIHPTLLVGMRNRLRKSDRPRRLFDDVNTTADAAGLLRGRRRVLDSTPLFVAVATQDTVIQLRAAIRKVLSAADRADPADRALKFLLPRRGPRTVC